MPTAAAATAVTKPSLPQFDPSKPPHTSSLPEMSAAVQRMNELQAELDAIRTRQAELDKILHPDLNQDAWTTAVDAPPSAALGRRNPLDVQALAVLEGREVDPSELESAREEFHRIGKRVPALHRAIEIQKSRLPDITWQASLAAAEQVRAAYKPIVARAAAALIELRRVAMAEKQFREAYNAGDWMMFGSNIRAMTLQKFCYVSTDPASPDRVTQWIHEAIEYGLLPSETAKQLDLSR